MADLRDRGGMNVKVVIERGRGLKDTDRSMFHNKGNVSDPFVVAMLLRNNQKDDVEKRVIGRTEVQKDNLNPVWNFSLLEKSVDIDSWQVLRFSVRDKDTYTRDSKIGIVDIPLKSMLGQGESSDWYKLQPTSKMERKGETTEGEIHLTVNVFSEGDDDHVRLRLQTDRAILARCVDLSAKGKDEWRRSFMIIRKRTWMVLDEHTNIDLRSIVKCEISGNDVLSELSLRTAKGTNLVFTLSTSLALECKRLIEEGKRNASKVAKAWNANEETWSYDATFNVFQKISRRGAGTFGILGICSIGGHLTYAEYDDKTDIRSMADISDISAPADSPSAFDKHSHPTFASSTDDTEDVYFRFRERTSSFVVRAASVKTSSSERAALDFAIRTKSIHKFSKWHDAKEKLDAAKVRTRNSMETQVKRSDGAEGLLYVDYSDIAAALKSFYKISSELLRATIGGKGDVSSKSSKDDDNGETRSKSSDLDALYKSAVHDTQQTFVEPVLGATLRYLTVPKRRGRRTISELPDGMETLVSTLGIERAREQIMQILLNEYGTKVAMRYGMSAVSEAAPDQSFVEHLHNWHERFTYFREVMENLGYGPSDDCIGFFPDKWEIGRVYAKNFIRLTKKDLTKVMTNVASEIASERRRDEEGGEKRASRSFSFDPLNLFSNDEDKDENVDDGRDEGKCDGREKKKKKEPSPLFLACLQAAKSSASIESFLDRTLYCPDDELKRIPGDSDEYDQFKGQLLQHFDAVIGPVLIRQIDAIVNAITKRCGLKAEECTATNRIYTDRIEIMVAIKKFFDLLMKIAPGETLKEATKKLFFTPSGLSWDSDDDDDDDDDDDGSGGKSGGRSRVNSRFKRTIFDWDGDGKIFGVKTRSGGNREKRNRESARRSAMEHIQGAGLLHKYAEALRFRLPGEGTECENDDIVNEATFVVYNTCCMLSSDIAYLGQNISEAILDTFATSPEICISGICGHLENVGRDAAERISNMISKDVATVMLRDPLFLSLFKDEDADDIQRKYHTASFQNGVLRHVAEVKTSLQYSPRHFMRFVSLLAVKLPGMYANFLAKHCAPLSSVASKQAMLDIESIGDFLKALPGDKVRIDASSTRKYDEFFKGVGKYMLRAYGRNVERTMDHLKKAIKISQERDRSIRESVTAEFASKWLLDDETSDFKTASCDKIRAAKHQLRNTVDLICRLSGMTDRTRKHALLDCELISENSEDFLGTITVSPKTKGFVVNVDIAGYTYRVVKTEEDFHSLIKAAKQLQQVREDAKKILDVPDPSSFFYSFNFLKNREEKLAPEYEELLQSIVSFATTRDYDVHFLDEFLETQSTPLCSHFVRNASSEKKAGISTLPTVHAVHVSMSKRFHICHISHSKFAKIQACLKVAGVADTSGCLKKSLEFSTPTEYVSCTEILEDILSLATACYRSGKQKDAVRAFFGRRAALDIGI
eukprot:g2718.t1